jgi:hypothetical protein
MAAICYTQPMTMTYTDRVTDSTTYTTAVGTSDTVYFDNNSGGSANFWWSPNPQIEAVVAPYPEPELGPERDPSPLEWLDERVDRICRLIY